MSSFGFTFLSRKALGQAEQLMFGGAAGVRDEVGFLIVHQRYSDRFFPGTSVLHTRLRYALLIPWIYETLRESRHVTKDFAKAYEEMEHTLTGRLKLTEDGGESDGVIGGDVYPRSISQPPSFVYWTALTKWGVIGSRPDGRPWSRSDMAKLLASTRSRSPKDDDGRPLEHTHWPISGLPERPKGWLTNEKMTLTPSKPEARFLAGKLSAVRSPNNPSEPSLLARLVGKPVDDANHCWDESILALAGPEVAALKRAGQAAALSAIGRAVYAALVETIKDERDKRPATTIHRQRLSETIDTWGKSASKLDMTAFLGDMNKLPGQVETMLNETWTWVRRGETDPMLLLEHYARAERSRKNERARLSDNQFGVDRRLEWRAEDHGRAEPLHFRWGNVKRLLRDTVGIS